MELKLYQLDAFSARLFGGNPAAVCPLDSWLPDEVMQAVATENNLSETAFFVKTGDSYHIRWFTPTCEVKLCGHATLASAWVIFNRLNDPREQIGFESLGGTLGVRRVDDWLELDFPVQVPARCDIPSAAMEAFGRLPSACVAGDDYILVFDSEAFIAEVQPDFQALRDFDKRGVIITAAGNEQDFVCRFFAPNYGIDEDPATGSAFTQLTPWWAEKTGKTALTARQLSARGAEIRCELQGNRVRIAGQVALYLEGMLRYE